MKPKIILLNQDLVRQKLRQKKYDDVCLTGWGRLDEFIHFFVSFGIFTMLTQLGLATGHSGIPVVLLTMLAFDKPLFGVKFDDNIKYLFEDHHLLRLLGFNIKQINQGCSKRTSPKGSKPLHSDTVRNFLKTQGLSGYPPKIDKTPMVPIMPGFCCPLHLRTLTISHYYHQTPFLVHPRAN